MRYFTWKPELVSNILWVIVAFKNSCFIRIRKNWIVIARYIEWLDCVILAIKLKMKSKIHYFPEDL